MFAAAIAAAGYLTLPMSGNDYLELLPVAWRTIGDQGIQIGYRHYDSPGLNPHRHTTSGVTGKGQRWEIHYDPYDLSHVFVRNTRAGGWITATWTHLPMVGRPFADFTWRAARQITHESGGNSTDQTAIARALDSLLTRAALPPPRADRARARTHATRPATGHPGHGPDLEPDPEPNGRTEPAPQVIAFDAFQAGDERRYR